MRVVRVNRHGKAGLGSVSGEPLSKMRELRIWVVKIWGGNQQQASKIFLAQCSITT